MQELLITNIQRMSFHDGPGMRTTVFLKGCNLRCAWCHNPETQNPQPELIFRAQRCVRCGTCVHSCASGARTMGPEGPVRDTARCVGCGRCIAACNQDCIKPGYEAAADVLNCKIAEYTKAVVDGRPSFHISLAMDISPNCDCHPENDTPIVNDIGMFASFDPVAIDQASGRRRGGASGRDACARPAYMRRHGGKCPVGSLRAGAAGDGSVSL